MHRANKMSSIDENEALSLSLLQELWKDHREAVETCLAGLSSSSKVPQFFRLVTSLSQVS